MKRIAFCLICFLVLIVVVTSGCAKIHYVHPNPAMNTPAEFEKAKYECEGEAYRRAALFGAPGNPLIIFDEMKRCLRYKGWVRQSTLNSTYKPEVMRTGPPGK